MVQKADKNMKNFLFVLSPYQRRTNSVQKTNKNEYKNLKNLNYEIKQNSN